MESAAFRIQSLGMCTRINQSQCAVLTVREGEGKGMRDGVRERC